MSRNVGGDGYNRFMFPLPESRAPEPCGPVRRRSPPRRQALLRVADVALLAAARGSLLAIAGGAGLPLGAGSAQAQMRIDVGGIGATQYPISVADFVASGKPAKDVVDIVRTDLLRSGAFRMVDAGTALSDSATPDHADFKRRGADSVLGGSVTRMADGRYDLRFRLHDTVRGNALGGEAFLASEADLRYAAHRIADWVYEKITGERGIFATRLLFVSRQGTRFRLNLADWDGENMVAPLVSNEPIMSPTWSPDGTRLAYVSFESLKPVVYVHQLSNGARKAVANFRGSNSAPAWSPDGQSLAVTLTREGQSQIFMINADGSGSPRRLTTSSGIDTEPAFSPDGRTLYFTSDRGGSPQIYRMPREGGEASRVTFGSNYNVSARPSPDGRSLAFISRRDSRYLVTIKSLATGTEQPLSDGGREESPSFSPNGRWVLYATQAGGRDSLVAMTIDGRVKQRLSSSLGDIREPSWGPFSK